VRPNPRIPLLLAGICLVAAAGCWSAPPPAAATSGVERGELPPGTLHVTVVDDASGKPVPRALVRVVPEGASEAPIEHEIGIPIRRRVALPEGKCHSVVTDEAGRGVLDQCDSRMQVVLVRSDAHAAARAVAPRTDGEQELEVRLLRGGTVRLRGAIEAASSAWTMGEHRDPHGVVQSLLFHGRNTELRHLAPGTHGFRLTPFRSPKLPAMTIDEPEIEWQVLDVHNGGTHELELRPLPSAALAGTVLHNGAPLSDAAVCVLVGTFDDPARASSRLQLAAGMPPVFQAGSTRTDALGRFHLQGLPPGRHQLAVTHESRTVTHEVPLTLATGDNRHVLDVHAGVSGSLEVMVARATATTTVWATFVDADGARAEAVSGPLENGRIRLDGLRPGRWEVFATTAVTPKLVTVRAGEVTSVPF
jgi:protocatechuate 3,4-dioxygenase beta subunit